MLAARRPGRFRSRSTMPRPSSDCHGTIAILSTASLWLRPGIEGATLVSRDEALSAYGVPVIW